MVSVGGRFGFGVDRLSYPEGDQDSEVIYFDKENKTEADEIQALVNKVLPNRCGVTLFGDAAIKGNYHSEAIRYFDDNSGIDAQVFLGPMARK